MCPEDFDGPCERTYAGCVATAMAQVMFYYKYPLQGTGSHSYNDYPYGYQSANFGNTTYSWNSMENQIMGYNNPAIAELLYHCGVSVNMNYGPDGSSASSSYVVSALINYFNYSPSIDLVHRDSYTDSEWKNILIENLDNKIPLYYDGYDEDQWVGHAFVCDGYQNEDYFHFNWGWSGYYNGYFYLDNLNVGGSNFSSWQGAIIYIYPATYKNYFHPH